MPREAEQVRDWWQRLGLPGLFDVHTHFLPPRVMAKVRAQFDSAGPLIGTNTDAGGFLQPLLRDKWKGRHAVLIGAGGAARAILFALTSLGVPEITIMARDPAKGQALLDRAGVKGKVIGMISIGDLVKAVIEEQQETIVQLERYIAGEG